MATKNEQNFIAFCDELRAYVEEHHLFPQKHSQLSHKIKYTSKKINEGTLEEWKRVMFEEIANTRDLSIHTGGQRKIDVEVHYRPSYINSPIRNAKFQRWVAEEAPKQCSNLVNITGTTNIKVAVPTAEFKSCIS